MVASHIMEYDMQEGLSSVSVLDRKWGMGVVKL